MRTTFPPDERNVDLHEGGLGFRVWRVVEQRPMAAAHTHPDVEVNFLFGGGFRYLHGGTITTVEPGALTVLWGGVPHQTLRPGITGHGVWMTLPLTWFLRWRLPGDFQGRLLGGEIVAADPDPGDNRLVDRWAGDYASGDPGRRRAMLLEMEARFVRLAITLPRRERDTTVRPSGLEHGLRQVERITDYLARHYHEPLTLDGAGEALGMHPKSLARLFRRHSQMSLMEYVTRLRLAHAQRLLLTTDARVVDIALEAGFGSLGPFYRAFSTHAPGLRPLEYRRWGLGG